MAVCKVVPDLLEKIQHDVCLLYQIFSVFCESYTPARPFHDPSSPLALNGLQPFCQGRLGHKEGFGGFCDASFFI